VNLLGRPGLTKWSPVAPARLPPSSGASSALCRGRAHANHLINLSLLATKSRRNPNQLPRASTASTPQWATISRDLRLRNLRYKHKLVPEFNPFTNTLTQDAIKLASNSTATGPDGLTSLHLKHLGPRGISYLTKLFNLSVNSANLPSI
jgi:hypothetical protein